MARLEGKVAIVTDGAQGIGAADGKNPAAAEARARTPTGLPEDLVASAFFGLGG